MNSPEAIRAVNRLKPLYESQAIIPYGISQSLGGDAWRSGMTAMSLNGTWYGPIYARTLRNKRWGIAIPPANPETGLRPRWSYVKNFVIFRTCKDPKLAWELIKTMVNETGQREFVAPMIMPAMRRVAEREFLSQTLPPDCDGRAMLETVAHYCPPGDSAPMLDWGQEMHQALEPVWRGSQTAEQACTALADRFNRIGQQAAVRLERIRMASGQSHESQSQ